MKLKNNVAKEELLTIIYARVSSKEQAEDGHSIKQQIEICKYFAKSNSFNNLKVIVDEGYSAKTMSRPGLKQMIELIKSNAVKTIIIKDLDRLSRNQMDTLFLFELFEKFSVQLIGAHFNAKRDSAHERLLLSILSAVAQGESEIIGERTIDGIRGGLSKGLYSIPGVPFGYKKKEGIITINEESSKVVKDIFYLYGVANLSTTDLMSLSEVKKYKLTHSRVCIILRDKRYIGTYHYRGSDYLNIFPPIIDEPLFNKVQVKMDNKRNRKVHDYLFEQKLRCNHCGNYLKSVCASGRSSTYLYYSCRNKNCSQNLKSISETMVLKQAESMILSTINKNKVLLKNLAKKSPERLQDIKKSIAISISDLDHNILKETISTQIDSLYVDLPNKKVIF